MNLKAIIENNDTGAGRIFDWIIQSLIVLSLVTFSIETLPDLSQETISRLKGVEMICIVFFSIEYFLRVLVADHKLKFIFSSSKFRPCSGITAGIHFAPPHAHKASLRKQFI